MFLFILYDKNCRFPAILALGCAISKLANGQTAPSTQTSRAEQCAALTSWHLEGTIIARATEVSAGAPVTLPPQGTPTTHSMTSLPTHCVVRGEVNHHIGADGKSYGDKFELRLPEQWSGRLLFQGGGGLDGNLLPALALDGRPQADSKSPLSRGYAIVSTDGGHEAANPVADGSFGSDPESRTDYYYRSTKIVTDAAKAIVARFYGRSPKYSYFKGCSTGGREGMIAAQRYAEYFNGVIAGAPAFNVANAAIAEAWDTVQFAAIAPKNAKGMPNLNGALSEADLKLLGDQILKECDELDGLKDGLVDRPAACHFDPAVLKCRAEENGACLSAAKVEAIKKVFAGPKTSAGKQLYSDWAYDPGVAAPGWRIWVLGNDQIPAINTMIMPAFYNLVLLAGQSPPIDILHFNFDTDPPRVAQGAAEINATAVDLSGLRKHGGKLVLYNGMSDPVFSANDLIGYYQRVMAANGGQEETAKFARLFLIPGMNHCGGGPALDQFDTLTAMENWVEKGQEPDHIVASGNAFPGRTRPLCPYPQTPHYKGSGSIEDAANFSCKAD